MTAGAGSPARPRVVVGVDGSDGSRAALGWALNEARLRGASVEALHAWQYPYVNVTGFPVPEMDLTAFAESARRALDEALDEQDCTGVEVTPRVRMAGAAHALLEAADGAELLVVGSRGRGGFAGLLLGSVSQHCAHHATCPVVIVPSPSRSR